MNILIIGSGGREHALGWKLSRGEELNKLFFAPGNAGTSSLGTNLNIGVTDFNNLGKAVVENQIGLVVAGPEVPLAEGIRDYFEADPELRKVLFVGPDKSGARLEASKDFAKEFMVRHNIPTARYLTVTRDNLEQGLDFLDTLQSPFVLKADGLAAGKGVLIVDDREQAQVELKAMLSGKFGQASSKVVVEEFLKGIELSVFIITDGSDYKILPEAKDYKRIGEGDTGLNTGGMGAVSPVPFAGPEFMQKVESRIIRPTVEGLRKENIRYIGFIFFGLINVNGDPYVIEYNVRMGDPETEAVVLRIKSDLAGLLIAAAQQKLREQVLEVDQRAAATVMLVSGGYPGDYEKGKVITGLGHVNTSIVFHAGTRADHANIVSDGGRVLAISSTGNTVDEALEQSYSNAEKIHFEKKYYRKDLGFDL